MHYWSGANPSKKRESRALVAAIQPIPKRYRVLQHWWGNRSEKASADDQRRLLEELTGTDGVIDGKLQGIVFPRWRAKQHLAENLLLQYARVGWPVLVGRDWNPDEMETVVTKVPHSLALEDAAISQIQVEAQENAAQGFATIVGWEDIKQNPPSNLKISPMAIIPHKSRKYRTILDM